MQKRSNGWKGGYIDLLILTKFECYDVHAFQNIALVILHINFITGSKEVLLSEGILQKILSVVLLGEFRTWRKVGCSIPSRHKPTCKSEPSLLNGNECRVCSPSPVMVRSPLCCSPQYTMYHVEGLPAQLAGLPVI